MSEINNKNSHASNLHRDAKVHRAKSDYTCKVCGKKINAGDLYIRVNPRFIPLFHTHMDCCPSKKQIIEMIAEERKMFLKEEEEEDVFEF